MFASIPMRLFRAPLLAAAAVAALTGTLAAQSTRSGPTLGFVVEGALEYGGDPVVTVVFEDGSDQEVKTGQGGTLAVGGELRPSANSPLAVRATAGFKYATTAANNANITFTRVPVEVVATYSLPSDFTVGAGYVRHMAMKFRGDEFADDLDFDDANGATVELGWRWLALTYTAIRYNDALGREYDASSAGVSLRYTFGAR